MLFSYNWLKEYISGKLPQPKKLAEILTMHSFEVTELKRISGDRVFNIDILPNRPDCLSCIGLAREISALLGRKLGETRAPKTEKLTVGKGSLDPVKIKIINHTLVPRYSAILLEGIEIKDSPRWLRSKLEKVGVRSVNNIVDITNFVMLETGQPLHAFDYDKIKGAKITLRMAREREFLITLDGIRRPLREGVLVIEDKERLIDLAGVMGGRSSEIDSKTKNVFLQAGNFERQNIARTVKKMGFGTQASNIYSQGVDPAMTAAGLERAHFLIKDLAGGKIVQLVDIYPKKVLPKRIRLDEGRIENLLGVKIPQKNAVSILKNLGFKQEKPLVLVPAFRQDINLEEDLVEEVGRIYGYQNIPAALPVAALSSPKRNLDIFWRDFVKAVLKESGFAEVYNYSFIPEKEAKIFGKSIELENPISQDYKYLRPSLLPGLISNISQNKKYFTDIKIFELGKVFKKQNGFEEKNMLSGLILGEAFYELKGIVDLLLSKLGISGVWYDSYQQTPQESKIEIWHKEKSAEIKVDGEEIGFLGEISPSLLKEFKIEGKVTALDIDFEKLSKLSSEEHEYEPISRFPSAIRDLAVLVPPETKVADVLNAIETAGGKLVRDVDLFDIYEGEEVGEGQKNFAFHIIYQSEDHTLNSAEVEAVHNKIIQAIEKNIQWQVRK
ncbi:MAG: phenylalanine--tRNA ligase subunit beta [Candidatus Nealsonbacteria bacterium]|nr:phenylalanine--tRNA ligase subunit beta [Candidatus Nealsonbacteria bacterium]